jgi:hypothetical protein
MSENAKRRWGWWGPAVLLLTVLVVGFSAGYFVGDSTSGLGRPGPRATPLQYHRATLLKVAELLRLLEQQDVSEVHRLRDVARTLRDVAAGLDGIVDRVAGKSVEM